MKIKTRYIIQSLIVVILLVFPGMLQALEPIKVMKPPAYYQRDWRLNVQNANNATREFKKYNCRGCLGLATKIEAELKSNEQTMIAAEKLLITRPINRQAGNSMLRDISIQMKILENSIDELKKKRQEINTGFENYDQKINQMLNMLSTVLRNHKEMETAIWQNLI